jgi:malate dehydrogenase (oxaloacetate-decarboxylating)(NADP+)
LPPQYLLPMYLDAGTNNEHYRTRSYLGLRKTRPPTAELFSFVDEFVEAVQEVFPKCCIHFEDWTGVDAVHLLERYRDKYCVYNDDVQGTAGITLAGMSNAAKLKGTKLKDEKYLFLGAGSAGIGLADLLCSALVADGMELKAAQSLAWMFDVNGLLQSTRTDLVDFQCRMHMSMRQPRTSSLPSRALSQPRSSASARSGAPSPRRSLRPCRGSTNAP